MSPKSLDLEKIALKENTKKCQFKIFPTIQLNFDLENEGEYHKSLCFLAYLEVIYYVDYNF